MAYLAGKSNAVLVAKKVGGGSKKLLAEIAGAAGGKIVMGECIFEKGVHTFVLAKVPGGLAKKLTVALLAETGTKYRVRVRAIDGSVDLDSETDVDPDEGKLLGPRKGREVRKDKRHAIRRFRAELQIQWAAQAKKTGGMNFMWEKRVLESLDALRMEELKQEIDNGDYDLPDQVDNKGDLEVQLHDCGVRLAEVLKEFDRSIDPAEPASLPAKLNALVTAATNGSLGAQLTLKEAIEQLREGLKDLFVKRPEAENQQKMVGDVLDQLRLTVLKDDLTDGKFDLPNNIDDNQKLSEEITRQGQRLAQEIKKFDLLKDPGAVPELTAVLQKIVNDASGGALVNMPKLKVIAQLQAAMEEGGTDLGDGWKQAVFDALHGIRVTACKAELDVVKVPDDADDEHKISAALTAQGDVLAGTLTQFVQFDFKGRKDVYPAIYKTIEGLVGQATDGSRGAQVTVAKAAADLKKGFGESLGRLSEEQQKKLEPLKVKLDSVLAKIEKEAELGAAVDQVQLKNGDKPFEGFDKKQLWRLFIDGFRQSDDPQAAYAFDNPVLRPNGQPREGEAGYMACLMGTFKDMLGDLETPLSVDSLIQLHDSAVGDVHEDHDPPAKSGMVSQKIAAAGLAGLGTGFSCNLVDGNSRGAGNFSPEGLRELQARIKQKTLATPQTERAVPKLSLKGATTGFLNDPQTGEPRALQDGETFSLNVQEPVNARRERATAIVEAYGDEIGKAGGDDQRNADDDQETAKLRAIVRCCQDLEQAHLFQDANCRTIAFMVLNKLLLQNGLDPVILDNPNRLDGFSEEQLITFVREGQAKFASYRA
jgi:anti-sigma28 factor (negative regulator of flagellin synthesis)